MEQFIKDVAEMRKEQKLYFRYRRPDHLQNAKKLERVVDSKIDELLGTENKEQTKEPEHPKLF
ncbi:hypothetical protein [uncultured Draconibacterium sp.]|uniref:hypothetical protein n=1 Tax=uncultured Draconibacterium sp. TaxID=1573823 RepID=UPI0025D232D2|nr:hypothetical protein [uncultured Draconibacterium sp.]